MYVIIIKSLPKAYVLIIWIRILNNDILSTYTVNAKVKGL